MTAVPLPAGPASPAVAPAHPSCADPADPGPCKATIPRFFFNVRTGRCQAFLYGGCRGNHNRFLSLEECRQRCLPGVPPGASPRGFRPSRDLVLLGT